MDRGGRLQGQILKPRKVIREYCLSPTLSSAVGKDIALLTLFLFNRHTIASDSRSNGGRFWPRRKQHVTCLILERLPMASRRLWAVPETLM
jgi:hypothetical protein